ncbi:Cro/Cl family transcriptional regulator [Subtercola sp. Z020]|uniref:nucleotidyltransferase domain-containing protein n=1 Tax=Subtercola sp. Z020 TaxID=2080582 RepID=UPI000CE8FECF|nr:nucleotidyltransferase domain-containing protein [Subtercola sp. Z020]PPF87822.1 Cro/Cl family transcriptional regulator [Subtercola sp. Z020]
MDLANEYTKARHDEQVARLRRALALRAMIADGKSQREVAESLGISQSAVSQQLKTIRDLSTSDPELIIEAAAPILNYVAERRGFKKLAVFGSVARHQSRVDSDIDLLIEAPPGTSIRDLLSLRDLFRQLVGRDVDLVTYGGLKPKLDDDIRREAVLL